VKIARAACAPLHTQGAILTQLNARTLRHGAGD
jgi:hypothetical protein